MTPIGVVGLGNLGTAIAYLIAQNGYQVLGWDRSSGLVDEINNLSQNNRYLPEITLPVNLQATNSLAQLFDSCQIIFIALPSIYMRTTLEPAIETLNPDILLVNLAKGIDRLTSQTSYQALSQLFPRNRIILLSGPSIANEFVHGMPTTVVIAGQNMWDLQTVSQILDNDTFRTRYSNDVIGVELGGILKNIYAIGLGMFDGKSITSYNFRATYLTIALEEIARFGVAMGARLETFMYLSGLGDLLATSMSEHSHNRKMGVYLAQDYSLENIEKLMGVLPEGYNTIQVVLYLAEKLHVPMSLAKGLWDVMNSRLSASHFISAFIKDFVD